MYANLLLGKNTKLIYFVAKNFCNTIDLDRNDVLQYLRIIMLQFVNCFDPNSGIKFGYYFYKFALKK